MVETQKPEEKVTPKEPTFTVTLTKSELTRIVDTLAESDNLKTFLKYHNGKEEWDIFKSFREVLATKTE